MSSQICSHTLAVAGDLINFLQLYNQSGLNPNISALGLSGLPRGRAQKGGTKEIDRGQRQRTKTEERDRGQRDRDQRGLLHTKAALGLSGLPGGRAQKGGKPKRQCLLLLQTTTHFIQDWFQFQVVMQLCHP